MWTSTYSVRVNDLRAEQVWKVWTDINQWPLWQDDVEFAQLNDEFQTGAIFAFHPKGGPKLSLKLTHVEPMRCFVDRTKFLLAQMHDSHEIIEHDGELELKCTLTLTGPLSFLWRKLVGEKVMSGVPSQMEALIKRVRELK